MKKIITAAITGMAALASGQTIYAQERPNVILILTDDMGFSDIGCYGGLINTPNLDALANNGLQYMQFYNVGRSCPTRASLITGLYPHQAGIGHMINNRGEDGYRGNLNKNCVTLGEVMKSAGYSTFLSGKYHVTDQLDDKGPQDNWPCQRGFDRFYGIMHGACSYYDPYTLTRDNKFITPLTDPEYKSERYYFTDAITDNAIKFIDDKTGKNPFFMYMGYTAAHWPMQAFEEDIAKYKGKFDEGWDVLRKYKYEKMISKGLIAPQWELTAKDDIKDWDKLTPEQKKFEIRRMEVYAAMVDRLDTNVGKLIEYLKKKNLYENTVILYMQDNGACAEDFLSDGRKRMVALPNAGSTEPMTNDELIPSMIPYKNREGKEIWQGYGLTLGADTTWGAYGKGWANVSNVPFREYKHWVHEGGIATPLIVHWPKGIKAKGEKRNQPSHLIDIMATLVDLGNAEYPELYNGHKIKPMEGVSLVPTFEKDKPLDREAIYFEHEGNCAVRMGKWKLVSKTGRKGDWQPYPFGKWELYDMENDRTETKDLSSQNPDLVKKMSDMFEAYALRANVYPLPKNRWQ